MTGRAVLALDEILCRITPDQVAAIRATAPSWLMDQADAAAVEVTGSIEKVIAAGLAQSVDRATDEHPEWVRLGVLDSLVTWWCGKHDACTHDPHPLRPCPVVAAAWRPGLIACRDCTHLLDLAKNRAADRTCDGCGRVVDGEGDDLMYPFVVVAGVLTYLVGVCRDCRYWETSTPMQGVGS